jgi:hypothetical protein
MKNSTSQRDPPQPTHLRVFLASPGDVAEERQLALEVLSQLPDEPVFRGKITVETVAWDKPGAGVAMEAHLTPQAAIAQGLPKPSECDLVIVILWSRLGTPLPEEWKKADGSPYLSGTEWEYLDALEAARQHQKPKVLLYRRTEDPPIRVKDPEFDDKKRQWDRVEEFFAALQNPDGSLRGGCNEYSTPADFKEKFRLHLQAAFRDRLDLAPPSSEIAPPREPTLPVAVEALRDAYLSRLMARCGEVSLAGIDPAAAGQSTAETRLKLNAVYTALLTSTPRQEGREPPQETSERPPAERLRSALEQLDQHPRLVLLGDPGSGKSTFAKFVALCLAGEMRGDRRVNLRTLTAPLPAEERSADTDPQPWRHGPLLPVLVTLRDVAATALPPAGTPLSNHALWQFIEGELQEAGASDYAPHLRKTLLEEGGLILLDGLDEVPEAEQRRAQIRQAVEDFVSAFPRCRVLVTSRIYAYQNPGWCLRDFAEATLAPFSAEQIRCFIDGWYAHIAERERLPPEDAAGRAALLKRAVFTQPALYELAQRPLLLTLMASLHAWRGGDLPEGRAQLYADAVKLLLNTWEQRRVRRAADGRPMLEEPSLAEYLRSDQREVRRVLETLAFDAHRTQPEATGTADIAEETLVGALWRLSANPDANPKQLLAYLRDRAELLHCRGGGVYTFPHCSFQEYLAACHLTAGDYPQEVAALAQGDPDRWREVTLLASAKAAEGYPASVWLLVETLCCTEPPEPQGKRI